MKEPMSAEIEHKLNNLIRKFKNDMATNTLKFPIIEDIIPSLERLFSDNTAQARGKHATSIVRLAMEDGEFCDSPDGELLFDVTYALEQEGHKSDS